MDKETFYGVSEDTITVTMSDYLDTSVNISDYLIDTSFISNDTISIDNVTISNWTWDQVDFEDAMPDVSKVEDMCKDYPALDKAYENFKTIYKLVHQDWVGRQKEDD